MATVKYECVPTRVKAGELCCGDFFIKRFDFDGIKTYGLYIAVHRDNDLEMLDAILVDDNLNVGSDIDFLTIRYDQLVEPVYVEITVKGYCREYAEDE